MTFDGTLYAANTAHHRAHDAEVLADEKAETAVGFCSARSPSTRATASPSSA